MAAVWLEKTEEFLRQYWLYILIGVFVLAEIRRMFIPKVERWRQDVGSLWVYLLAIGVLYFFLQLDIDWASAEIVALIAIVAFMAVRMVYSGIRLRYYKPPRREADSIGKTPYV